LCGGIAFAIDGELAPIQICYCKQCQRAQGTALATNIPVQESAFRFVRGAELLASFESSPGKQRCFCNRCGSPIFSRHVKIPGVVRVRAGTLDEPIAARPSGHFYVASKPSWWEIREDLPKSYAGQPPNASEATSTHRNDVSPPSTVNT
jgi:hypothetical protein